MKRAFVLLALVLFSVPFQALAQDASPKGADAQTPPPPPRELNLRLDEPRRGAITFGPAKTEAPTGALPTLGDDARRIELPKPGESRSPYPKGSGPEQSNQDAMR